MRPENIGGFTNVRNGSGRGSGYSSGITTNASGARLTGVIVEPQRYITSNTSQTDQT